jgi:hypothetical protein
MEGIPVLQDLGDLTFCGKIVKCMHFIGAEESVTIIFLLKSTYTIKHSTWSLAKPYVYHKSIFKE